MENIPVTELYSLLIPLADERLIVPRASVAEVISYQAPEEMAARSNAFSTRPRYSRGERRNTAISSNRTPSLTSSRIRRAISSSPAIGRMR